MEELVNLVKDIGASQFPPKVPGWDGHFSLTMQSNAGFALEEFVELDAFLATETYRELPMAARWAVDVAWVKAKDSLKIHRDCIASFTAPWFDGSDFQQFEFEWQSTPALWAAFRPGYDGAPDSGCKVGLGKTKHEAAADLIEQEEA